MYLKLYSGFLEQLFERVISIAAKGYEAFYFSVHQHLSAEYTWWMCGIDRGTSEVNAVERCLYDNDGKPSSSKVTWDNSFLATIRASIHPGNYHKSD